MGAPETTKILLMADDAPWCLWAVGRPFPENGLLPDDALPLSDATKRDLRAWLAAYDAGFGRPAEWQRWTPPADVEPGSDEEEEAWCAEGRRLAAVQAELGPAYEVGFEA